MLVTHQAADRGRLQRTRSGRHPGETAASEAGSLHPMVPPQSSVRSVPSRRKHHGGGFPLHPDCLLACHQGNRRQTSLDLGLS